MTKLRFREKIKFYMVLLLAAAIIRIYESLVHCEFIPSELAVIPTAEEPCLKNGTLTLLVPCASISMIYPAEH